MKSNNHLNKFEHTFVVKSSESLSNSLSESKTRESESLEQSSSCGDKLREREIVHHRKRQSVSVCVCENESVSVKDNTCRGALAMDSERVRERECEHDS